jgi:CxxC-x17-CxxC domain-containing protein
METGSTTEFNDRLLSCQDCGSEFIFTAGEQLFFHDKQFKNDPKRCKPCKSRRAGLTDKAGSGPAAAGISRTETRTHCSECGIETTVPFKPTQGRPVLCRQCFQVKAAQPVQAPILTPTPFMDPAISALTQASANDAGAVLSQDAAVLAVSSMASASPNSSVATAADLASISGAAQATPASVPANASVTEIATALEAPQA